MEIWSVPYSLDEYKCGGSYILIHYEGLDYVASGPHLYKVDLDRNSANDGVGIVSSQL